jgi:hypothetical protein
MKPINRKRQFIKKDEDLYTKRIFCNRSIEILFSLKKSSKKGKYFFILIYDMYVVWLNLKNYLEIKKFDQNMKKKLII